MYIKFCYIVFDYVFYLLENVSLCLNKILSFILRNLKKRKKEKFSGGYSCSKWKIDNELNTVQSTRYNSKTSVWVKIKSLMTSKDIVFYFYSNQYNYFLYKCPIRARRNVNFCSNQKHFYSELRFLYNWLCFHVFLQKYSFFHSCYVIYCCNSSTLPLRDSCAILEELTGHLCVFFFVEHIL